MKHDFSRNSQASAALLAENIHSYLKRIQLPRSLWPDQGVPANIELLSSIQAYHLSAIPFENLALHYTAEPFVSLDIDNIYRKLVEKGRGGYCMENNLLFYHVLCFFGFQVYMTGARIYRPGTKFGPKWSGWEHCVNIVTFRNDKQYLVDVGFGGNGPRAPVPLDPGLILRNIGSQDIRLVSAPGARQLTTYQFRNTETLPWTSAYAFSNLEFTLEDLKIMNFYTSQSSDCPLASKVLVVKFIRENEQIIGKLALDQGQVKQIIEGEKKVLHECENEADRVGVLESFFNIRLCKKERSGIRGRISALKF